MLQRGNTGETCGAHGRAMTYPYSRERCRLLVLTVEALELADSLQLHDAAIHLNAALVELNGAGQPPRTGTPAAGAFSDAAG